jgi:hypothetical protein
LHHQVASEAACGLGYDRSDAIAGNRLEHFSKARAGLDRISPRNCRVVVFGQDLVAGAPGERFAPR